MFILLRLSTASDAVSLRLARLSCFDWDIAGLGSIIDWWPGRAPPAVFASCERMALILRSRRLG